MKVFGEPLGSSSVPKTGSADRVIVIANATDPRRGSINNSIPEVQKRVKYVEVRTLVELSAATDHRDTYG